jgi:hypothetical protein
MIMTQEKHPTPSSTLRGLEQQIEAAREFVKRHPALTLIDLAEFEGFLKIPAMMEAVLPFPAPKDTPQTSPEGCNAGVIASKKRLDVCRAWADLALENERLRDRAEAAIVAANALQARLDAAEAALREQVDACDTDDCEMCHRHRELLATSGSKAPAALSATATEGE